MLKRLFAVALLAAVPLVAAAQDKAFTNRATDLKDKATAESRTLASLPADTEVKVVGRGGQWTQVEAQSQRGWVRPEDVLNTRPLDAVRAFIAAKRRGRRVGGAR